MPRPIDPAPERDVRCGSFRDGVSRFEVYACGPGEPEVMRVYEAGEHASAVLTVSGLRSGDLKAAWGAPWRECSADWRRWMEEQSFGVFYNGDRASGPAAGPLGRVRTCNG